MSSASRIVLVFALVLGSIPVHAARVVLVAGGSQDAVNVPATEARLKEPFGTDFDKAGNMFIIEMASGNRLLKVNREGILTHVAGTGEAGGGGDGGPALKAQFNGPHNLAVLPDGSVLVADTWNGRVRQVNLRANTVSTLPGWQTPVEKARGSGPYCVTLDFTGAKLYIADLRRIHVIDLATGNASVVAGNGTKGRPEDGALAKDAPLVDPRAVAPDRRGN
ncbi:MAG: hypothetical protein N2689_17355, partial [Verrucomicrobiae bacterium]|nr:hypothetical protein [Verrucomicrobiae bacterium]